MPRFYLHIRDGNDFIEDLEGSDLPDIRAAREEAEAAILEMLADRILGRPFPARPIIEVYDLGGKKVAELRPPARLP
ncbi:DUF6894 family protein [Neorhizobium alkalisoli]|jgi:hypothetical protein|uniref:DUF6894 domain-containing protein n=1 Tax=Neorhizobium alkalisoli TaxID=528178 RepID=A0A561QVP8_9HYPH|nr:hypothetical protein [Neorhizobium alkalisoli]TWF54454.1 hypothetical protein FHW37_103320 [Neorhizobium alkalisoli]